MKRMKNLFTAMLFVLGLLMVAGQVSAQTKFGYISLQELITAMPEYKKAEADMGDYRKALGQQGDEYQRELARKDSIFSADSTKWTAIQKDLKRKEFNELYLKVMNFNQQAQNMVNQKEEELLEPIQQKAIQTTQAVAKENGYTYVFPKEQLIAYPAGDDLLPLVAKKLNVTIPAKGAAAPPAGGAAPANKPTGKQ